MKTAILKEPCHLLGTGLQFEAGQTIYVRPATNIPDKGKYFAHAEDDNGSPAILLEREDFDFLPDCYLHVLECSSGQTWMVPIKGNMLLDLRTRLAAWAKQEFAGELKLDGELMPKLEGDYCGKIMTDNRPPDSVVCWQGAGFYLKSTY